MHDCLLIPEILEQIFCSIYPLSTDIGSQNYWERQFQRRVARRSLAALSRVCHSLNNIALDVLWAQLKDLEPLFTCFPQDLWTRTSDQKILIRRPVTTTDWSVFERYSSRVQILGDTDSDILGGIDAEFIYAVMSFCSQSLLVPNLQVLYCRGYPRDLHLCMRYLLGPNLIYLCLLPPSGDFWTSSMSSVLSGLGRHSPRLEVVEVIQCQVPPNVAELALCGLPHLRKASLVLPDVGDSSWLSRLVGLQELYIHFAGLFFPVWKSQLRTCTLDKLVIGSRNLTITATIVEEWVVPCRELQLNCTCPESAVAFENALRSFDNRLLCDVLERILLDAGNLDEHIDNFFTLRTFTPLMRFSGLKEVDLSSLCTSLLDDHALGSIVESWPRLECLHLGTKYFWKTPPKITFRGLVTVLSSCPDLRELGLVFNAKKVDPPTDEKPGGGVCNTNITTFDVGFSPIEKPLPVAIALSAILPYLRKIDVEFGPRNTDLKAREAKWREVLEHIGVYALIGKQEGLRVRHRGLGVQCYDAQKIYSKSYLQRFPLRVPSDEWNRFKY